MKRKQFTEKQIIGILKEHAAGSTVADLSRRQRIIEDWRQHYNEVRPHRSLNGLPPAVFARQAA